ncbi:hypothetical protein O181_037665 [Austropuccinia psidii MF-1]|uniref:Uncharacterized protein n=1 Tax=Austropuccinia psidii MF-1 TaxID=1389203 RepID=A0A9Q3HDC8_9BASI|nr:hypothetical protein [Austropuccinia psidii MF-1]
MVDAIREISDYDQDPIEDNLVAYQYKTQLEIQYIQLDSGLPQDTENKSLCKHTPDAPTFLITPTKGMAYFQGTANKITVFIDNAQHLMMIYSGSHFSIVAREHFDKHFPNLEKKILQTKAKNVKVHQER